MIYLYHGYDNNRYITTNIFKYHILLIYLQEFSFPFPLLTLFKFLSTRKTIFSIGCRTLFMYPDPRWYGMIPSVWNCRNLKHYLFMIFENLFWISICSDTLSNYSYKYSGTYVLKTNNKISKDINWKNVVLGRKENMGSPNAWDFST